MVAVIVQVTLSTHILLLGLTILADVEWVEGDELSDGRRDLFHLVVTETELAQPVTVKQLLQQTTHDTVNMGVMWLSWPLTLSQNNKSRSEPGNAPRIGIGHREVVCQK